MNDGQFSIALKRYNQFLAAVGPQPEAFYCRTQQLFDDYRELPRRTSSPTIGGIIKDWCVALALAVASVITLLRAKVGKLATAHYLIDIKNSNGVYDRRSEYVLRELPPEKTINFFHVHQPRNVFSSPGQRANAVYFESLWKVVGIFIPGRAQYRRHAPEGLAESLQLDWEKQHEREVESQRQARFWQWLFRWLGVKRLVCLDDSRHTGELRLACQREGIETCAYMHARFNEYHVGLARPRFDRYLVWSGHFKSVLGRLNGAYDQAVIVVAGHPGHREGQVPARSRDITRVLWLCETNVDPEELQPYVEVLKNMNEVEVIYRGKPGFQELDGILGAAVDWRVDESPTFFESLRRHQVSVVVGTHSSALLESWLGGVPALMLGCSYDYAWPLVEQGVMDGCHDARQLPDQVRKLASLPAETVADRGREIWGANPAWQPDQLKAWLNTGANN